MTTDLLTSSTTMASALSPLKSTSASTSPAATIKVRSPARIEGRPWVSFSTSTIT
nr:hypothetical protein [Candidatus Microthrix sp.]